MEKKKTVYNRITIRYGMTNFGTTLVTTMASTFFAVFLTDAVGMSAALMGMIISIAGIVDTFSVPCVGIAIQKGNFKSGKFRPWILWGGIACAILSWVRFVDIGLTGSAQVLYYGALYSICYIAYNFAYSAYTGLLPVMAKSPSDRVSLASCRIQFNALSKFCLGLIAVSLISFFGGGESNTAGYSGFAALLAVIVFLAFFQLYMLVKPIDIPVFESNNTNTRKIDDVSVIEMFKSVISVPVALFFTAGIMKIGTFFTVMSISPFYYQFVIGNKNMLTVFLSLSTLLMIVGATLTPYIARLVGGARNAYITGGIIYGGTMLISYLFRGNEIGFTVILCVGYIGYAFMHSSEPAVYSTIVDYTQYRTGKDMKGFLMSLITLSPKLGSVLQGAILGIGLTSIGFVASNITPEAIEGLPKLMSLLPAILMVITVIAMRLFPLTDKKVAQMQAEMSANTDANANK